MTSVLEYLTDIRTHGARPIAIGGVTIGRTYYAAGTYMSAEVNAPEGSRAHREGRTIPSELVAVLFPVYSTNDLTGPVPAIRPASHRRSSHTLYRSDQTGRLWYVAAWNDSEGWLQLRQAPDWLVAETENEGRPVQVARPGAGEAYDTAVRLSSGGPVWPDLETKLRGVVRHIAADWHGGQVTALCSFATTGAVRDDLVSEIDRELAALPDATVAAILATRWRSWATGPDPDFLDLMLLRAYVRNIGERGPVEGWSQLWA